MSIDLVKRITLAATLLAAASGCGAEGGGAPSQAVDPAATTQEAVDTEATGDACVNLTVKNYLSWCKVGVNGGAKTIAASQTVCVAPGSRIKVAASPKSSTFELGPTPWHDTVGDTGGGDPGNVIGSTSHAVVHVGKSGKCAWACCPFAGGTGCPTVDQCP